MSDADRDRWRSKASLLDIVAQEGMMIAQD